MYVAVWVALCAVAAAYELSVSFSVCASGVQSASAAEAQAAVTAADKNVAVAILEAFWADNNVALTASVVYSVEIVVLTASSCPSVGRRLSSGYTYTILFVVQITTVVSQAESVSWECPARFLLQVWGVCVGSV